MLEKKNPRKVDFSNGCVDIFNFKKGEHSLMLYSYVYLHTTLHREYFLILRFEFSKFSRLKS